VKFKSNRTFNSQNESFFSYFASTAFSDVPIASFKIMKNSQFLFFTLSYGSKQNKDSGVEACEQG